MIETAKGGNTTLIGRGWCDSEHNITCWTSRLAQGLGYSESKGFMLATLGSIMSIFDMIPEVAWALFGGGNTDMEGRTGLQ